MTVQILMLAAGLLLILFGANYLVNGASSIAKRFGLSEFVIGVTVVGIGTSTPEMVVSFFSAFQGKSDMAVGNIVGSNIFNTMMILGATAMISPLVITRDNLKRDIPINIVVTVLLIILGLDHTLFRAGEDTLGRVDGLVLLAIFVWYLWSSFRSGADNSSDESVKTYSIPVSLIMIAGGLAGLVFGGRIFVSSASEIASSLGVSDKFISITVMAAGTSMPELATCVVAALKGRGQMALGNVLGSNISNILLILGGSALIYPLSFSGMSRVDLTFLVAGSLFVLLSAFAFRKGKIDRIEGALLLVMEGIYLWYLIMNA